MTPLEDRVVPAFVDVSGLRFDIPGNFNSSAVVGGTKYDGGPAAVSVGLTPVGAAAFQPLFTLDGGGSVTDRHRRFAIYLEHGRQRSDLGHATDAFRW